LFIVHKIQFYLKILIIFIIHLFKLQKPLLKQQALLRRRAFSICELFLKGYHVQEIKTKIKKSAETLKN